MAYIQTRIAGEEIRVGDFLMSRANGRVVTMQHPMAIALTDGHYGDRISVRVVRVNDLPATPEAYDDIDPVIAVETKKRKKKKAKRFWLKAGDVIWLMSGGSLSVKSRKED